MKSLINSSLCLLSLTLLSACSKQSAPEQPLASGIILNNIDNTVRPQDNFYRYVNGTWLKTATIPADKTAIGAFYELRDKADEDVKAIIEELAATPNLSAGTDEQKVADLFRSYMDQETRDKLALTPIQSILEEIKSLKNPDQIVAFFAKYQASGITTPMQLYISVDAKNASQYATHIWQGGLGLPDRDYYFNEDARFADIRQNYLKHINNIFQQVNLPNGEQAAQKILNIETKLASYHWTKVQTRDSVKRYNKFATEKLPELTSNINWSLYLNGLQVANEKAIIINQPDFIQGLGKLLNEVNVSDWQDYLTFHTISTYASYLTSALDKENFEFFNKTLSGLEQQKPQWKRGVSLVNSTLGEVIGKVYVSRHFTPQAKQRMGELVENLRNAYGESIDTLTWMSSDTKAQAHIKLQAFTPKIGYPDKWEDYSALTIKADDLVGNIMRAGQISHQKEVAKLGGPIHTWEWGMTPQTVNAYYNPTVNEIVFPAAILQPPFFNMAADDAVNYGAIGAVIGHEMGHGFDDQGSRYDAEGNLRNWWTEEDLAEFSRRAKNLVSQFNNYHVFENLTINGELTLGENIGDLSGVTIAYKAYKTSLNGKEAPIIDGLTGDQRFFFGFAQVWRNKKVEKTLRNAVATDPHSPGEFRALGALSNTPEFYQAFDLNPGDAMYIAPEQRVKIW